MPWKRPSKRKNDNNENDKTATKITKADPEVLKKIAEEILPTEKPDNTKNESQKQESQTSVNQEIGYYGESPAKGSLLGDAPVQEHETIQKQKIEKETANNDVNQEQNQNQISESQWNNFEPVVEEIDDSEKWRVKREKERDGFIPDDVKIYLTDSNFKLPPQIWNLEIWCYQPINLLFQVASKSFLPMPEYQYWEPTVNHYQNSNNNNNSWNNSGYNNSYQQNNQSNSNYCSGSLAFNGTICQLENVQMDKKKFKNVVTCFMLQHCFPDSFFLPKDVFTYRHQLQLGNDANWPNKVQDYHGKRIEQITKQNETKGHKVISSIISQQSEKWCKIIDSEQFRYCLYKSTGTDGSIKDYLGTDQDIEVGNQEQMREIRRNNLTTLSSKTKGLLSPPGSSSAQNNINNFNTNGNGLLSNPATYTLSEDPQNVNDLDWEALSQNENLFGINNKPIKLVALNDLKLLMCWYFDWQTMNDIEESADQTKSKKIQAFYTEKENRAKKIQELKHQEGLTEEEAEHQVGPEPVFPETPKIRSITVNIHQLNNSTNNRVQNIPAAELEKNKGNYPIVYSKTAYFKTQIFTQNVKSGGGLSKEKNLLADAVLNDLVVKGFIPHTDIDLLRKQRGTNKTSGRNNQYKDNYQNKYTENKNQWKSNYNNQQNNYTRSNNFKGNNTNNNQQNSWNKNSNQGKVSSWNQKSNWSSQQNNGQNNWNNKSKFQQNQNKPFNAYKSKSVNDSTSWAQKQYNNNNYGKNQQNGNGFGSFAGGNSNSNYGANNYNKPSQPKNVKPPSLANQTGFSSFSGESMWSKNKSWGTTGGFGGSAYGSANQSQSVNQYGWK